jgi:hypothetical protein
MYIYPTYESVYPSGQNQNARPGREEAEEVDDGEEAKRGGETSFELLLVWFGAMAAGQCRQR